MPAGLQNVESSLQQLQTDYRTYAQRRQVLAAEVSAQELSLKRIKQAIREERQAISNIERHLLCEEKEAFEVFRSHVLQDLNAQCTQLQLEQNKLRIQQRYTDIADLDDAAQHTCWEAHIQRATDPAKASAQLQAFRSEQAELIADLQQRLVHLAGVTAIHDDDRENQLHRLQQQMQESAEAVRSQHRQLSKDRIELQAEKNHLRMLRSKMAPSADMTWSYNQHDRSLAQFSANINEDAGPRSR